MLNYMLVLLVSMVSLNNFNSGSDVLHTTNLSKVDLTGLMKSTFWKQGHWSWTYVHKRLPILGEWGRFSDFGQVRTKRGGGG